MGDIFYTVLILWPLFFWLAVFVLIIYFIGRWLKNKIRVSVEPLYQQLTDSKQKQELLTSELEEVKTRLSALEPTLKDAD